MELATRANGWMTCSTAWAKSNGQMDLSMRVNISLERSTDEATTAGMTVRGTMASGRRTKSRAWEPTHGLMAGSTRANGSIITWMD